MLAFGEAVPDFGIAGRASVAFGSTNAYPMVEQLLVDTNNRILGGGDKGLTRFAANGALDTSFGAQGKTALASTVNFVAEASDPSNGKIYVLVSASGGTGLFRYSANGVAESSYGQSGTVTVTTSKTFTPQALAVQSDGKVLVAGVFKTDSTNGRKVRIYRLKADGTTDTTFGSGGSFEFNLGASSFLGPVVYDQVAGMKVLSSGKILVGGGSIDYSPAGNDPDTGQYSELGYNTATFAVARLTSAGALDSSHGANGIARAEYATSDQIAPLWIQAVLPRAFATRSNDSAIVAGYNGASCVAEFNSGGTSVYNVSADANSQLDTPIGITALSDGRAVVATYPGTQTGRGFTFAAVESGGTIRNVIFTADTDTATADIDIGVGGGAIATASDGQLLIGGGTGSSSSQYVVQKLAVGSASDARPDEFANARANDLARDTAGGLHLAYYDAASTTLKYAYRAPNGLWKSAITIDSKPNAGQYLSIDTNSKNQPGIAYFDGTNGDLKFASYDGKKWVFSVVESKGSTGLYPSLDFDNADRATIAYYQKTGGNLRFASLHDTGWYFETADSTGDTGRSCTLVASPNSGRYTVAYANTTTGSVMWAQHKKGGVWTIKVAATTKGGADFISMAYGSYYLPAISYYDAYASDLKLVYYSGGQFYTKVLASKHAQGLYTSLYFGDYYADPSIYSYNKTQDKITLFTQIFSSQTSTDLGAGGGRYLSVAYDGTTTDAAWFDAGANKLMVRPAQSPAGSNYYYYDYWDDYYDY